MANQAPSMCVLPRDGEDMNILAIDPGTEKSASCVLWHGSVTCETVRNDVMLRFLSECSRYTDVLAIEMVASYGMPVGREVFETCVWIGRFIEAWGRDWEYVYRRDVKLFLCNSARAKDANVRQAIIDRFPQSGGGKRPQIGTKSKPGPLHGVKGDEWSAIGVALAYQARVKQ